MVKLHQLGEGPKGINIIGLNMSKIVSPQHSLRNNILITINFIKWMWMNSNKYFLFKKINPFDFFDFWFLHEIFHNRIKA